MQASARLSSSAASRRVTADVSGVITGSCYRTCRGKAKAAALSGQEPVKGQKRISKDERRVQIKEFVEIYKTSNGDKFPTTKMVQQHVGGSFYTVRELLQEVIYNHAKLPLDKSQADISKNANNSTVSGQTETKSTKASMSCGQETKSEPANHHGETEDSKLHLNIVDKFQNASEPTVLSYQTKNDEVIKENAVDREENHEVEHQGSMETSFLESLKSFASGIRNFWKKN